MEQNSNNITEAGKFIEEYSSHMMGCGVHTSRVIRSARRIGEALGYNVRISVFQKSIILALHDEESGESYNEVINIPSLPISFDHNSALSALSWEAYDKHLTVPELREKYNKIINSPKMNPLFVLLMVGLANASFCRLFGGDWLSMGIVFFSTLAGFYLKQQMTADKINHYITFITSAFVASLCASMSLIFDTTSEIALATSVLFLVPGVPLINGVIDVIEGHILSGFSRLVHAALLIVCIATGLSFTLMLVKNSLL